MPGKPLYHGVEFSHPARSLIDKLDQNRHHSRLWTKITPPCPFFYRSLSFPYSFPLFCFPVICFGALPDEPFTRNGFAATTPYGVSPRNGFPSPNALKFKDVWIMGHVHFSYQSGFHMSAFHIHFCYTFLA